MPLGPISTSLSPKFYVLTQNYILNFEKKKKKKKKVFINRVSKKKKKEKK